MSILQAITRSARRFFAYLRRSQDSEDRQEMSIPDQKREILALAERRGIQIVRIFEESRSAKRPGRPVFTEMVEAVERGEADGILCWDLNRLSRNLKDAGWVGDLFVDGRIKEIATPRETYTDYHHLWSMWNQFLSANQYVVKMAQDIQRGREGSLARGFWPAVSKLGYVPLCECPNGALTGKHKRHRQVPDPLRAHIVKRCLELVTDGAPAAEVFERARSEWRLTVPQHGKLGGGLISRSVFYAMLHDPFYAGVMVSGGKTYQGNHEPLISWEQHQRLQARMRKQTNVTKASRHEFTYRGLIACARCQATVTAEYTTNRHGTRYTYYRCSRKQRQTGRFCPERSIQEYDMEEQIVGFLRSLQLPAGIAELAVQQLPLVMAQEREQQAVSAAELEKLLARKDEELLNLSRLCAQGRMSEEHLVAAGEAVKQEQYDVRSRLMKLQKAEIVLQPFQRAFSFVNHAVLAFENGDDREKRELLWEMFSNLTLGDRKLSVQAKKPYALCAALSASPSSWAD